MPAKRSFYEWACKLKIMFLAKCDVIIAHLTQNSYMEGSVSATIKYRSRSQAPEEDETSPNRNHIITRT